MASLLSSATCEIKRGQLHDIQELRRANPSHIPPRYIREEHERPEQASLLRSNDIPVIDMSKLFSSFDEMSKLQFACQNWGFFQVVNHGVEIKLLESMEKVAKEFFILPVEEKEKYPMETGAVQGYGHAFVFSEDQTLDWCNMLALGLRPLANRKPHLWPKNPPYFSETFETYSARIKKLCERLLEHIADSLGLKTNTFNEMFGEIVQGVRMNYYPPCSRPDLVLGLSPHSDGSALTVLQQDNNSVGLQIFKDNSWIPVFPIHNALVINLGDTLEVLTNGKYKSIEHRAVTNEKIDRLSIVTFYAPNYSLELGPMPEFINENQPCMYKRYSHGEYSRHYITNKLQGKKSLDFVKIQTKQ
ncbi:putative thebaine 6-O-demethylase [Dioscorea sansibarensis]